MARLVNSADDEILLASRQGQISRFKAAEVRCPKSRSSRGVRLLALNPGDEVQACSVLAAA
jgi:DNA gyrase/topoisomerase IV subunit A